MVAVLKAADYPEIVELFEELERLLGNHLHKGNAAVIAFTLKAAAITSIPFKNEDKELEDEGIKRWLRVFSPDFISALDLSLNLTRMVEEMVAKRIRNANKKGFRRR